MIDFLIEHRMMLVLLAILSWAWFAWALKKQLSTAPAGSPTRPTRTSNRVPVGRKPADVVPMNRTSTGGIAPSIEAGIAEHHIRSAAATTKLSTQPVDAKQWPTEALLKAQRSGTQSSLESATKAQPPTVSGDTEKESEDAGAMDSLFAGLKDGETTAPAATEGEGTRAIRRSTRMQEIGFHHPIESDKLDAASTPPPMVKGVVTPAVVAPSAAAAPSAPAPRSQTAELDDILKRIDQVLADTPAAPTPKASEPPTSPAKAPGKLDPSDVLKRIDEALGQNSLDRSAEMTVVQSDWAAEAKRVATSEAARGKTEAPATAPPPNPAPTPPPAAKPSPPPAMGGDADLPDWARSDIQDEDLEPRKGTDKPDGDDKGEKGDTPSQQKLF